MMTLMEFFHDYYIPERDLQHSSIVQVECTIRLFTRFLGHDATLDDFKDDLVNRFLVHTTDAAGQSKRTAKGRRQNLLSLWRNAYDREIIQVFPKRVRKIKVPRRIPDSWTHEELAQLIAGARKMKGFFRNGVRRRHYFEAFIRAAYDTGLRKSDLLRIKRNDVRPDGSFVILQQKTQDEIVCQFGPATLEAIEAMTPPRRPIIFEYPYRGREFYEC